MLNNIQRVHANNKDTDNQDPSAKQDCSDIIHISLFFDGTGNNYEADTAKKNGPILLAYGEICKH